MMTNIISMLTNSLDDLFVNNTANQINEQPSTIKKLLTGIVPTVLLSLINRKGNFDASTFRDLFAISNKYTSNQPNGLVNETNILRNAIFGDYSNKVNHELANYADITPENAGRVVDAVTPQILNNLTANKPSDMGIMDWLWQQKNDILAAVPNNLNLASVFGLTSLTSLFDSKPASSTTSSQYNNVVEQRRDYQSPEPEKKSNGLLWIVFIALAGLLAWWLFGKGCNEEKHTTIVKTDSVITNTHTTVTTETVTQSKLDGDGNYIYDVGDNTEIKLADGSIITIGNNSTEYKLFDFLTNGTIDEQDKTKNWITCDRIYFKTGGSELTDVSTAQIENIAKILKNFPKASIKLGGYTDNTGDAAVNKKLSASRAKIVADKLMALGVDKKQVVEAEGYGPEHPIATNDTDEGRAQNRRVDLKVASK